MKKKETISQPILSDQHYCDAKIKQRPYKRKRIRHNYGPGLPNDSLQDYKPVSHLGICIVQNSDLNGKEIYLIIFLHFSQTVISQLKKEKKKPLTLSSIKSWLLPHCCAGHPRQAFWPATGPLLLPASVPAVDLEPWRWRAQRKWPLSRNGKNHLEMIPLRCTGHSSRKSKWH